jgi:hypothetical protein
MGPGVTDGDSAIVEKKVAEYTRWRELQASYIALRSDHRELLVAADPAPGNFAPGRPALGFAFFRSLAEALPNFVTALADRGRTSDPLPFNVLDPADPGHWMATVRDRARLEPVVEYADEAINGMQAAHARLAAEQASDGAQPEPSSLVQRHGSELRAMQRSHVARQVRDRAATERARNRGLNTGTW